MDADGIDPSIAPVVNYPAPRDLLYFKILDIFRGIAENGIIVGFDLVEIFPILDVRKLTLILVARLLINLISI